MSRSSEAAPNYGYEHNWHEVHVRPSVNKRCPKCEDWYTEPGDQHTCIPSSFERVWQQNVVKLLKELQSEGLAYSFHKRIATLLEDVDSA